jgi:hypothetical protein
MNVKRTELLKVLKQCLPGIENGNSVLEGVDLFIFSKGCVYSYNDTISVSVPVKSEGLLEEGIEGAVRAEEFYGIINKFSGDLIEFIVQDDKWILKSGKAKVELSLMAGNFSKRVETIAPDKDKWQEIPPEFTQGLGICKMAANKSGVSGLHITSKDIMSTDGFQINSYKYEGAEFANFWISDASANELLKVGVLAYIQLKDTWAHFRTSDNVVFSVKTLQAEKWPYEKILTILDTHKKTKTSITATFPKELFDAIDRAANFCLDISDRKAVRLLISPKRILVSAERIAGKFEEKVEWKDAPPDFTAFELYVDTGMILFAARRSMSFYVHEIEGNAPRMIFTTDNSIHLMTTLLIDDEVKKETKVEKKLREAGLSQRISTEHENEAAEPKRAEKKKSKVPQMYEEPDEEEQLSRKNKKAKSKPADDDVEEDEDEETEEEGEEGEPDVAF